MTAALRVARALAAPRGVARLAPARLRGAVLRAAIAHLLRSDGLEDVLDRLASGAELGAGVAGAPAPRPTGRAAGPDGPAETVAGLRRLPASCLHRALAGYAALRASGEDARFVIGVAREGDEVLAHAWIEHAGAPVGEPADPRERFTVAYAHPRPAHAPSPQEEDPMAPPRPSPEILLTRLGDGTGVLLHLGTKFYYTLNRTGVAAWEVISAAKGVDRDAIVDALVARFAGVDRGQAESDVDALLRDFEAEGLLAPEG